MYYVVHTSVPYCVGKDNFFDNNILLLNYLYVHDLMVSECFRGYKLNILENIHTIFFRKSIFSDIMSLLEIRFM